MSLAKTDPFATVVRHPSSQHSPRSTCVFFTTTLSSLCVRFSTRPVGDACDPGSCHNFHGTDVDRELEYAYRSKKVELRGKRVEQNRNPV